MSKLYSLYWERFADEPGLSLEAFLDEVVEGRHGEFSQADIVSFIREVEQASLSNIEAKAMEAPHIAVRKEDAIARLEAETQRLLDKYGD